MVIRDAKLEDIENGLLELYIDGYNMHYDGRKDIFLSMSDEELRMSLIAQLDDDMENFILIVENEKIVGYASYQYKNRATKSLWIDELIIDEAYRKRGYGKRIIEFLRKRALENECARVELNCWSFNDVALAFYKVLGYSEQRVVLEKEV